MASDVAPVKVAATPVSIGARSGSRWADRAFRWLCLAGALAIGLLLILVLWQLIKESHLSMTKFGWRFFTSKTWDPNLDVYGALPFIYGTVVTSLIALIIAVPLSIGTAIYLTDLAPVWLRQPLTSIIEM